MATAWSEPAVRGASTPASTAIDTATSTAVSSRWRFEAAHVVYIATALWAAVFAAAGTLRHLSFNSARYDLGNMTQAIWSTANGRLLETTEMVSGVQFSRLGAHVDPLLAVLTPLWMIWPSPLLLVIVQPVALALGALPVFWLGRKHLGSPRLAASLAAIYLLYPTVQWNSLSDFHAVSVAMPLILFAVWYLDEDNFLAFLPFAVLAAASKEHMPLIIGSLAVWYAVRKGRWALGLTTAAACAVWVGVAVFVVLPHYAPPGVDLFADRFGHLGDSPSELAHTIVTDPLSVVEALWTTHNIVYLLLLLGPLVLLVFEPLLAFGALVPLSMNLLSDLPQQTNISSWYSAPIFPVVLAASILGARRLSDRWRRRWAMAVLGVVIAMMIGSPLNRVPAWTGDALSSERDARAAAVALIPPEASVSATNHLGAHLSERREILGFPVICAAEWVAVDRDDTHLPKWVLPHTGSFADHVSALRRSPQWRLVYSKDGIQVFHRITAAASVVGACPRSA
jgi:uncharacterized membrane protein